ncbi:MAG: AarF/UbiB family protein [Thermodesulfobacteriota bacterium]|nr:AarF/UbiB family protein [Thermodesulfobacteriota bacterium]
MLNLRTIGVIGKTYRHIKRYRQILAIFFKYGFGNLINALKIDQYLELGLQMISKNTLERAEKLTQAEKVRLIFEELGPAFIKLGQILSTRPDLIPIHFTEELEKLQDNVPPFSYSEVKQIIDTEFESIENHFNDFEKQPFAAASIGQVHIARLKSNNKKVAVKIQRPGIKKIVKVDLEIMLHLATLMERHIEEAAFFRPVKIVEEFAETLEKELDYTLEASNMERVAQQVIFNSTIHIPKVFLEQTWGV